MFGFQSVVIVAYLLAASDAASRNVSGTSIPPELAYLLPASFHDNSSANFIDTTTSNQSVNNILSSARKSYFYSFDKEFEAIVGSSPHVEIIQTKYKTIASEGGSWVPEYNQVWFPGSPGSPPYSVLNLNNNTIDSPKAPSPAPNLAGSDYYNGTVYFASVGTKADELTPAVYALDSKTKQLSVVLNSYFGLPLNSVDDLAWVSPNMAEDEASCVHPGEPNLFFTTFDAAAAGNKNYSDAVLPSAIYRYSPSLRSLQAVISRADVLAPNGLAMDAKRGYLYVTDAAATALAGVGSNSSGTAAIYRFKLDADCNPERKQMFALVRSGIADGIRVDNDGRVWTAEGNGIVVRNRRGKEIGVFNMEQLVPPGSERVANFALAGNKLVILAFSNIFVVTLSKNVTSLPR